MTLRTVSCVRKRRTSTLVAAAIAASLTGIAALAGAAPARAGLVPALGSPFGVDGARAVDVADADGNGFADVAIGGSGGAVVVRHGDGTGRLGPPAPLGIPGPVEALAGGDLDGDGDRDYAALVPGDPQRVVVHRAAAAGGYSTTTALPDAGDASDVAIGDLDGAAPAEVVVADGGEVTVLAFDGEAYAAGDAIDAGAAGSLRRIALADLDGDGRLDLVGADGGGVPAVVLLRGDGAGGFAAIGRRPAGLPSRPTAVAATDVNGDGRADVVAGAASGRLAVLHGDGAGGLAAAGPPLSAGDPAAAVADLVAADINRDTQPDVVAASGAGSVSVLLNTDTGLLAAEPLAVDFGALPAGSPPQQRTVLLRAVRGRVRIARDDLYGSGRFAVAGGDCVGRTLLLGQACALTVSFAPPRRVGEDRALLSVDATAAAVVVPMTGGVRPPLVAGAAVRPRRALPGRRLALRYELSEDARVRVRLDRALPGRRAHAGRCVPPRRRNLRRPRCRLWEPLRSYRPRAAVAGANLLRLRARNGRRRLESGVYRLAIVAVDAFRNRSDEAHAAFRVRRGRFVRRP